MIVSSIPRAGAGAAEQIITQWRTVVNARCVATPGQPAVRRSVQAQAHGTSCRRAACCRSNPGRRTGRQSAAIIKNAAFSLSPRGVMVGPSAPKTMLVCLLVGPWLAAMASAP
jgi:hypothetical protein